MDFGARLKELRTSLNYSQKELSEQTGLTLRTIQRIENNEVKPSLYSLKMLGEALKTDLSEFSKSTETKPYEFNFTIKITDMNQLMNDIKTLVRNNWKTLLWIVLVVFFISNYDDIKSGILDGWNDAK
jgi:transcriptional regulator with XRE-family HTH domain